MKPAPRLRRAFLIAVALLALFTLVGFFVLPPMVKSQVERRLSAALGRAVTVGKIQLNPYALSLTLDDFAIREQDGTARFLGWRSLYVNFDALSSLRGEWVISEIALDGFGANVAVKPDQSLNFSDILAKLAPPGAPPPAPEKPARPVRIVRLKVSGAAVAFSDSSRKKPFATTVGPLTFALTEFRTVSERGAPYRFEAVTEAGERLAWAGTLQAQPLQSAGELALENFVLAKYAPYYADLIQADLTSGTLTLRGRYEASVAEGKHAVKLSQGAVELRGLKLVDRATQETAIEVPALDLHGIQADATTQKASIDSVALTGGRARVRREKDGSINLIALLQPATGTPHATPTPPPTTAAPPVGTLPAAAPARPDVSIGTVTVKDFQVNVTDLAAPRPVQLDMGGIQFSLRNLTLADGAQMPLELAFTVGEKGTVHVAGDIGLFPVKAGLKTEIAALELRPVSPYLEQFVNAHLTEGALTATLAARAEMKGDQPLAASVSGEIKLEKVGLVDAANNEELAGFGSLALAGLDATTAPSLAVNLKEIAIAGPYARVVMNPDHTLNLTRLARTAPPATTDGDSPAPPIVPPSPNATTATEPRVEIAKIALRDGDFRFTDRSVEPNVRIALNQFGGTITGVSSTNPAKADVDLKAMVDGSGPVAIAGKLDALGATKSVDLKVDFKNVDLQPFSPYSGKYAGFELARGKLLLDIKVNVDGQKIDAANVITLNQFTFGNAVKSRDATSLPVRLGVALLKDLDGKIVIDVPVQGSTDDPNFKISRVVWRVIGNLLTKAAVSPFSLLGAAFGGGGDELAYQEFQPGSTEIQAAELKKLQTMVQALKNRPGLNVDLEGGFDAAADAYALKRVKLADTVRRAVWEEKRQADPNTPPPAQLVISPEENAAMLKLLFDQKFPPGTPLGAPLPPPPTPVTPPPVPAGFFKRMVNAITLQSQREARAAREENDRRNAEHAKAVEAARATGLPVEEMTGRLAETMVIDDNDLRALAQARAQQVREYFTTTGQIAPERLFLAKDKAETTTAGKGSRVFLTLQ